MAVIPKRTKYRRPHRLVYDGEARGNRELHFGEYGLMALEGAWITQQQIEASRVAMTRYMKRGGKVWIYKGEILPTKSNKGGNADGSNSKKH